jgi:hypothetical protein
MNDCCKKTFDCSTLIIERDSLHTTMLYRSCYHLLLLLFLVIVLPRPVQGEGRTWLSHHEPPHYFMAASGSTTGGAALVTTTDTTVEDENNSQPAFVSRRRRRPTSTSSSYKRSSTTTALKEVQPVHRHVAPSTSAPQRNSILPTDHTNEPLYASFSAADGGAFAWEPELGIH